MRSLRYLGWVGAAIVLPVGLAGCIGGKRSSQNPPGQSQAAITKVSPTSVTSGSVPACTTGQAHRNVCCTAGPNAPAECGVYVTDPFHACASGATTYPDPTTCCDLNDPTSCAAPPPVPTDPPPPVGCGYYCPPGWYASGSACCSVDPSGNGVCYATAYGGVNGSGGVVVGTASGGGSSGGPSGIGLPPDLDGGVADASCDPNTDPWCAVDAGPACDPSVDPTCPPDAGEVDAGGPDASCDPTIDPTCCVYDGGVASSGPPVLADGGNVCIGPVPVPPPPLPPPPPPCTLTCPDGWQQAVGQPDLCCIEDADGTIECFSQAVGPVPVPVSSPPSGGTIGVAPAPTGGGSSGGSGK